MDNNPIREHVHIAMNCIVNFWDRQEHPEFMFSYGVLYGLFRSCHLLDMMEYWKHAKSEYMKTMYGQRKEVSEFFKRVEGNYA